LLPATCRAALLPTCCPSPCPVPLPSGRLPPFARGLCPVVGCRLLPKPLPRGRLPPFARGPCPVVGCRLLPKVPAQW
ncbi:unnamed protein product, partial [Staurois parvus]